MDSLILDFTPTETVFAKLDTRCIFFSTAVFIIIFIFLTVFFSVFLVLVRWQRPPLSVNFRQTQAQWKFHHVTNDDALVSPSTPARSRASLPPPRRVLSSRVDKNWFWQNPAATLSLTLSLSFTHPSPGIYLSISAPETYRWFIVLVARTTTPNTFYEPCQYIYQEYLIVLSWRAAYIVGRRDIIRARFRLADVKLSGDASADTGVSFVGGTKCHAAGTHDGRPAGPPPNRWAVLNAIKIFSRQKLTVPIFPSKFRQLLWILRRIVLCKRLKLNQS